MKSTERHKLKENEFAHTVARAREVIDTRGRDMAMVGRRGRRGAGAGVWLHGVAAFA